VTGIVKPRRRYVGRRCGHGDEDGYGGVVVVVNGDVGLGGVGAEEAAHVLDDAALEGHREGEDEGVEAG
jgi:hypothetical protein